MTSEVWARPAHGRSASAMLERLGGGTTGIRLLLRGQHRRGSVRSDGQSRAEPAAACPRTGRLRYHTIVPPCTSSPGIPSASSAEIPSSR
jgi:hypothetical protein